MTPANWFMVDVIAYTRDRNHALAYDGALCHYSIFRWDGCEPVWVASFRSREAATNHLLELAQVPSAWAGFLTMGTLDRDP